MEYLILFLVVFIFILVIVGIQRFLANKRKNAIPGLHATDRVKGNLSDIAASGSLHGFLIDLHNKYGKIASFWLGSQYCVSIASPHLFKEQIHIFDRPSFLVLDQVKQQYHLHFIGPLTSELLSHSIQFSNGLEAQKRLHAYAKSWNPGAIQGYFDLLIKYSKKTKQKWLETVKDEHIPLSDDMFVYSLQVMLATSFGKYFENEEVLEFKKAYDIVIAEIEDRIFYGIVADVFREEKFQKNIKVIQNIVLKASAYTKNNPPTAEYERAKFIHVIHGLNLPQDVITADLITIIVAGVHTAGYLLTWAIYFMALHPEVQENVYNELNDILGEETIVFEAVNKLTYMRQVLDETLRCSVLAPFAARVQDIESKLGGYKIPAGTPVVLALGVMLQDETIWPEPKRFDPDRFNEENRRKIPNYAFEPFGLTGKRKCIGYRMGYFQSTVLLSELIREFKLELVEGQSVKSAYGLITRPKDEIWIQLSRRN